MKHVQSSCSYLNVQVRSKAQLLDNFCCIPNTNEFQELRYKNSEARCLHNAIGKYAKGHFAISSNLKAFFPDECLIYFQTTYSAHSSKTIQIN